MAEQKQIFDAAELSPAVRTISYGIAMCCALLGIYLLFYPPDTDLFPPQCGQPDCLTQVRLQPTQIITVLFIIGAVTGLFAANGRKLLSLKVGSVEVKAQDDTRELAKRALEGKAIPDDELGIQPPESEPTSAPAQTILVDDTEYELYKLEDVPIYVMRDALQDIDERPYGSMGRIEFIARKAGKGNHPWLLKFRTQGIIWKISYGGYGKEGATVSRLL